MIVERKQVQEKRGCLGRIGDVFAIVVTLYAVLVLIALVISLFLPDWIEIVGLFKGINGVLLLPVIVLLPLSLLLRRWRVALLLMPVLAALVILYGSYFLPRSGAQVAGETFDVLTFNLKAPEAGDVDSLVEVLRQADADIVALQELSFEAADRFETALSEVYPYMALYPQEDANAGQGILSRFEIAASDFFDFDAQENTLGHVRAELVLDGRTVVMYNVHPLPPFAFSFGLAATGHGNEIDSVLALANEETQPVLLLGDFNMSDQFEDYAQVTARYADTYREVGDVGFGFTYPAGGHMPVPPVLRLDYVFHDESFAAQAARVWPDVGSSDHHPVWARLVLLPE